MVHGGQHPDKSFGALTTPIYQSSTFVFESADHGKGIFTGEVDGHVYTRYGNPTTEVFERKMARLEHCEDAAAFSSGLAATMGMILTLAQAGDNIIADDVLYGGTHGMLKKEIPKMGIEVRRCDTTDLEKTASLIDDKTRLLFIETPANPTMKVVDIAAAAELAREKKLPLCVDSTFATPYLQVPVDHGSDMTLHSATKYISGHGDVVAGVVCGPQEIIEAIKVKRRSTGACMSPFDSWLLLRGLKTLGVRVQKGSENAMAIAKFLSTHPKVEKVHYPGLPENPHHEVAKKQMDDFGAMLSFDVKGGIEAGKKIMNSVQVHTLAVSLGDCDTLIQHPASMTHSTYTPEEMAESHITPGMIRISVGIEDAQDLIDDLAQCLDRI
jgi:methionine-gamma-lyase